MTFTVQLKDRPVFVEFNSDMAGAVRQDRNSNTGQVHEYIHDGFRWVEYP